MRTLGRHGRATSMYLLLAAACTIALLAGCTAQKTIEPTTGTLTPTSTVTASDTPLAAETATEPATVEPSVTPPPPPPPDTTLPYKPGPDETGTNYAYLTKLSLHADGYVYATVDYIIIGEGPDGVEITNDNPKLRTFPLAAACPCRYLTGGGADLSAPKSPTTYLAKWKAASSSSRIRKNPYKVTVKHGVITKFDNAYLP
jgi:hypothetical protein